MCVELIIVMALITVSSIFYSSYEVIEFYVSRPNKTSGPGDLAGSPRSRSR